MKTVFYSENLKKYFDTKKECEEAEKVFAEEQAEKEKEKEIRANDAKEVEEAYKNVIETRKQAAIKIQEANELIEKAEQEYLQKRKEFVQKHGSFHMTYSNADGNEEITVSDLFNAMKDLFKIRL